MDRAQLLKHLDLYQTSFDEEIEFIPRFKSLLSNFPNCYLRSLTTGHMTASAWIFNEQRGSALLLHHKKLNRWLQPGGHADGNENIISVATQEAEEETGLSKLKLFSETIFDLDIHLIPQHKNIAPHFHYDVRFLFLADKAEPHNGNEESNDLKWIPMDEIQKIAGNEISLQRMVLKTKLIF